MRSRLVVVLAVVVFALQAAPLMAQPRGPRRGDQPAFNYGWRSSLQAGLAEARKTGKPLMVVVRCVP